MNFLEWMGFNKVVKDTADVLEFPKPKVVPPVPPVAPPKKPEPREHYRVGYISETQMTTFTIMGEYGTSMTLSMNKPACEQLIKMIRATYEDEDDRPTDDPDGGLPVPVDEKEVKAA